MTEYDDSLDDYPLTRGWKEFWGRRKVMEPIPFDETSIMTQPITFNVGTPGHYLPLPALTAAIVTSSTGQKQVFEEGGFKELQEGAYTIQYVDLSERYISLPRITASTKDGSEVSITISINYKINNPLQLINVLNPLDTLFSVCESAIQNFIVTHHHEELISEPGNNQFIPDHEIIRHVKDQVDKNRACRAFWVVEVIVKERYGNPEIGKVKHERLVQEKQSQTQKEKVQQEQIIAEEQKELEKIKAEQENMVKQIQAVGKANRSEISKLARLLDIELETLRKQPDMQQEQIKMMIDLKKQALGTLLQLYTVSGFPRDGSDLRLLKKIIGSLSETQVVPPELPSERSKSVNDLSSTIINLITPKDKE
jgi:hypothetical protein